MSALQTLTGALVENELLLEALPLISLWEHLAQSQARDVHATVLARLERARAATRLGCMSAAAEAVAALMAGARLPCAALDSGLVLRYSITNAIYQVRRIHAPATHVLA